MPTEPPGWLLTLRLAIPHRLRRGRSDEGHVSQTRHEHGRQRGQDAPPVRRVEHAGDAGRAAAEGRPAAGVGQGEDRRDGGLHAEVDGEELRLEGGELRPVEHLEGDDAVDE